MSWGFVVRVLLKAALLFALANAAFAALRPLEALGGFSLYNVVFPGRERLPYSENPALSYSVSTFNIPAMFGSHVIERPKANDEYRLLILGDSAAWGWRLDNPHTLAGILNAGDYRAADGRRVVAYNLGYPIMSLTKDLLLLDEAMKYQPDGAIWLVTLASFPRDKQLFPPLVQHNPDRTRALIGAYDVALDPNDVRFVRRDFWGETLVGRRRDLADWLRLQFYGAAWAATRLDQFIPADYEPRAEDFEADLSWESFDAPTELTLDDLAFDVLAAGAARLGDVPLWIVNEPMFISAGTNSDLRYNAFYPRWAYDAYRERFAQEAAARAWQTLDLWDALPPDVFTDSPVHMTPDGGRALAGLLMDRIDLQ